MANLVELSNQLEYVPQEQLVQMSQDPNSMFPSFLVLSEIQRRNQMRKMYEAQQPKPQTTVAEEVVQEFTGQQGLQGAMAQSPGPQDAFPPSDMGNMAPPSPMQAMASGGIVGYKNKGKTEYKEAADDYGKQLQEIFEKEGRYKKRYSDYEKGERFTYPLTPRDYVVSDEEYSRLKEGDYVMGEGALQEYRPFLMLLNALDGESGARYMPESEVKGLKAKLKASIMEDKLSQMGMASGGRTGYQVGGFTPTAENPYPTGSELVSDTFTPTETIPIESLSEEQREVKGLKAKLYERYVNPDGTFNTAQIAKDGLSTALVASYFTPAGAIRGGLGLLGRGFMSLSKPFTAAGREGIKKSVGRQAAKINPKMVRDPKTGQFRSQAEIGGTAISSVAKPIAIGSGVTYLQSPNEEINPEIETAEERAARLAAEDNAKKEAREADIAAREQAARDKEAELLAKAKESRQADMLVGLGGAIMSAKNIGELGTGISDVYTGIQRREDAKSLTGLQGRLLQAQASQIEANIAGMDLKELQASAKIIGDGLEKRKLIKSGYDSLMVQDSFLDIVNTFL